MSKERSREKSLYNYWIDSKERKIFVEYEGRPIEEVPEEYRKKIEILRELVQRKTTTYEDLVNWLETHNGKMPRSELRKNGAAMSPKEMKKEEREEINIYRRWTHSNEKKILDEYKGRPIEEVPEEFREKIAILRSYGIGLQNDKKMKSAYDELVEWLETHDGQMPRCNIKINGRVLKRDEMTEEQRLGRNLYERWRRSKERQVLDEYAGRPIEEVPEEFREKIKTLRDLGQMGRNKDESIERRMKKAVGKQVENNESTRNELQTEFIKEFETEKSK